MSPSNEKTPEHKRFFLDKKFKPAKKTRNDVKKLVLHKQYTVPKPMPELKMNPNIIPSKHPLPSFERYLSN